MRKNYPPTCEHLDYENKRDCDNETRYVCMCCGSGVCPIHKTSDCPYGGMGYIEVD